MSVRWYLKREQRQVALVVERMDGRGYQAIVHDRPHAREWLPKLRALVLAIDTAPRHPTRTYTPEEADV